MFGGVFFGGGFLDTKERWVMLSINYILYSR
jgi:hypothetical protein